jgi:hypothetical protein
MSNGVFERGFPALGSIIDQDVEAIVPAWDSHVNTIAATDLVRAH